MTLACKFYCKKAYPNTILVKSFAYIDQGGILYWCSIHHNFWYRKAIHMQQCCGCGIQKMKLVISFINYCNQTFHGLTILCAGITNM